MTLASDLLSGETGEGFGRSSLQFPTTMAEIDGRAIVVNSQFDRGRDPELPFSVAAVPIPPQLRPSG